MIKQVTAIHGAPRSGTTWLGQIFRSQPQVAYRYQPLFSYRFKDRITTESSAGEIARFLEELEETDDEFILQTSKIEEGAQTAFSERLPPSHLVFKEVRYHHLIERFLSKVPGMKCIGIVRNPCGVMNSWLSTPREFDPEWNPEDEWRDAPSKNAGRIEEYYGFSKWKELTNAFLDYQHDFKDQFLLVRYEDLVNNPESETIRLFDFVGLSMHPQVEEFLSSSQKREVNHPDSVFRQPDVKDRWKDQLAPEIQTAIHDELQGTRLEQFLH